MEIGEYALMDAAEDGMWWYRALHVRLLDALAGIEGPVLDAGCGTGGLLALLAQRPTCQAMGVEFALSAASRAKAKSGRPVVAGSVNGLPFASASFAAAVSADVLCHAAVDPVRAAAELYRVLRPGGRVVINMPAYAWLASAHDQRVHNIRRISAPELYLWLTRAGFQRLSVTYWNGLLLPIMVIQRKILARKPNSGSDVTRFPQWLDAFFYAITALERRSKMRLPAGGSILAIGEKP